MFRTVLWPDRFLRLAGLGLGLAEQEIHQGGVNRFGLALKSRVPEVAPPSFPVAEGLQAVDGELVGRDGFGQSFCGGQQPAPLRLPAVEGFRGVDAGGPGYGFVGGGQRPVGLPVLLVERAEETQGIRRGTRIVQTVGGGQGFPQEARGTGCLGARVGGLGTGKAHLALAEADQQMRFCVAGGQVAGEGGRANEEFLG